MLRALFVSYASVLGGGERILVDLLSRLPDCDATQCVPREVPAAGGPLPRP